MLKKRILASSLASVMALSSVSVVAFADETATIDTEAVTKAVLKEYVASFDKFVEDELEDYGEIQTDRFNKALDAANVVINDRNSTTDDATAAYQMLKAVVASLKMYTKTELEDLIADCKADYETENVLNEAFGDEIWKAEGWDKFVDAYDRAEAYVDSNDSAEINDAYLELYGASEGLTEKEFVTKGEFRKVFLEYTDISEKAADYEPWRRGTCSVNAKTGKLKDGNDKALNLAGAKFVTYAELWNIIYGASNEALWDKATTDQDRGVATKSSGTTWIKLGDVDSNTYNEVNTYIDAGYEYFLENATSNRTTNDEILTVYKSAKEAVAVYNGWTADNVKGSSKVIVDDMLKAKRGKFLSEYYTGTGFIDVEGLTFADGKLTITDDTKAAGKAVTINKKTKLITIDATGVYAAESVAGDIVTLETFLGDKYKDDTDLTSYVPVTSIGIQTLVGSSSAQESALTSALGVFDDCVEEDGKPKDERNYRTVVTSIDDNGTVGEKDRASKAYALIVRDVKYALDDLFVEPAAAKTLTEISDICKKARILIEETGDAFMFRDENDALAVVRADALEWLSQAKADKDYEDGDEFTAGTSFASNTNSDGVYNAVNDAYNALNDKAAKYKYSYGDVAELIADVAEGIDDGIYGASESKIQAAVSELAYKLITLDSDGEENEAFDDKGNLIAYNRINSDGNAADKALYADYEALLKAVEDATKEPEKPAATGDLDGDGKVLPGDAKAALELFLNEKYDAAADMDGNGVITPADARAILEIFLKG